MGSQCANGSRERLDAPQEKGGWLFPDRNLIQVNMRRPAWAMLAG